LKARYDLNVDHGWVDALVDIGQKLVLSIGFGYDLGRDRGGGHELGLVRLGHVLAGNWHF